MATRFKERGIQGFGKSKRSKKKTKISNKTSKPSKGSIKKRLDKVFSEIVREKGFCERCNKKENLQCSHIFSRSQLSVRWDLDNAFCLCAGCHLYWWHKNPIEAAEFTKQRLGEDKYKQLILKSSQIKKWSIGELNELYLKLCQTKLQ